MRHTLDQSNERVISAFQFKPRYIEIRISKAVLFAIVIGILFAFLLGLSYFNGMLMFKELASAGFILGLISFLKIVAEK